MCLHIFIISQYVEFRNLAIFISFFYSYLFIYKYIYISLFLFNIFFQFCDTIQIICVCCIFNVDHFYNNFCNVKIIFNYHRVIYHICITFNNQLSKIHL